MEMGERERRGRRGQGKARGVMRLTAMVTMALGIVTGSGVGGVIMAARRKSVNAALARHKGTTMTDKGAQVKNNKKEKTLEEEIEDEQQKLDEEMEKRRRRSHERQELRRKEEEFEREKHGEVNCNEPKAGKTWTLEAELDDEEAPPVGKSESDADIDDDESTGKGVGDTMVVDTEKKTAAPLQNGADIVAQDGEIDPLDAFVNTMILPEVEKLTNAVVPSTADRNHMESREERREPSVKRERTKRGSSKTMGRIIQVEDSDTDYWDLKKDESNLKDEDEDEFMKRAKKTKLRNYPSLITRSSTIIRSEDISILR